MFCMGYCGSVKFNADKTKANPGHSTTQAKEIGKSDRSESSEHSRKPKSVARISVIAHQNSEVMNGKETTISE